MFMKYRTPLMNAATADVIPEPTGSTAKADATVASKSDATATTTSTQALPDDLKALFENPDLFKARMSKEREAATKGLVKELGFEKLDEAKSFFAEAKKEAEAKKTEAQRTSERIAALEPLEGEVKNYESLVDDLLSVELEGIPPSKKALLEELAPSGDKPDQKRQRLLWVRKAKAKGLFNENAAVVEDKKAPATSRAGNAIPPAPAPPAGQKHPREMTPDEFKRYEQQKLAERTARR